MKRVIIVHGYGGWPNGGWRTWLMRELDKIGTYACAVPLPHENAPSLEEWIKTIEYYAKMYMDDDIYLVGHSLGSTAILRFLEANDIHISGAVLVSAPIEPVENKNISNFLADPFNFEKIKKRSNKFSVIHGDNDSRVPVEQGEKLASALGVNLLSVQNGGHLTGSEGWEKLPQVIKVLTSMFESNNK